MEAHEQGWEDRTLTMPEVWRYLLRVIAWMFVLTIGLHALLWGWPTWADPLLVGGLWIGIGVYLASIVVHELLHIVAMLAFGVPVRSIRIGARLREGVVYVHAGQDLTVWPYRVMILLPAIVLGIVPGVAGLVTGSWAWTIYAFVMLISAAGDFAVLDRLRGLPSRTVVRDHPEAVGCRVRVPADGSE